MQLAYSLNLIVRLLHIALQLVSSSLDILCLSNSIGCDVAAVTRKQLTL